MTKYELIEKLKPFPDHYEVEVLFKRDKENDLTSDIAGVCLADPRTKIISLEINRLLSE